MRKVLPTSLLLTFLLFVFSFSAASPGNAQGEADWQPPIEISRAVLNDAGFPANSRSPTIVADSWGKVHAIWVADLDASEESAGNALFYSSWDGEKWSNPNDIYFEPRGGLWKPRVVVDTNGWLHLAWTRNGKLYYSRARVENANQANSWTVPYSPSTLKATNVSLAVDSSSNVHAVFCYNRDEGYLAYLRTTDVDRWTTPVELASVEGCWTRIALDEKDRLHVVYSEQPGSGPGSAVYYLSSDSRGSNWDSPRIIDDGSSGYVDQYGPSWINVAAIGPDEVHIVWHGAPSGQRWHQWSEDGGDTWSEPSQLFPNHRGLTEPVALAADSEGTLHMVTTGWLETEERPIGPYYSKWKDGKWAPLTEITKRTNWDPEGPEIAIAGGNKLVTSWRHQENDTNQAWTAFLSLDAPAKTPPPRITRISETDTISQQPLVVDTDEPTVDSSTEQLSSKVPISDDPSGGLLFDPILAAFLFVALFLIATIAAARYFSKRNQIR